MLFSAQYGIGPSASITGGPNALSGRTAACTVGKRPGVRRHYADEFRIRSIGRGLKPRDQHHLVGQVRARLAEELQHVQRARQRMRDDAAGDQRADRVEVVLERRGNAEVAAAAANGPEEVGVLVGAGAKNLRRLP